MLEVNRLARRGGAVFTLDNGDKVNVRLARRGEAYLTLDATTSSVVPVKDETGLSGMIVLVDVIVTRQVERVEDDVSWQLAYARQNVKKAESQRKNSVTVRISKTFAVSLKGMKVFVHGEFSLRATKDGLEVTRLLADDSALRDVAVTLIRPALLLPADAPTQA